MKVIALAAVLAAAIAVPALAADAVPASAPAQAMPKFSADTPIGELMADERSKAVIEARMPGIDKHPMYETIKGMSLRQIQPFSEGRITEELLAQLDKDLSAIH
jgi:opacity protein-like surface antigen